MNAERLERPPHKTHPVELAERTLQLERAEERFRAIIGASPVPLILSRSDDGTILYVNERLCALIGTTEEELVGKATPDFYYDPSDRPAILHAVRTDGYVRDLELRIKRADGTPLWVSLTVQPMHLDGERTFATALLDITERKEAEQLLSHQKALLEAQSEAAIDGTLVVTEDGKILSYNERFLEMWDIPRDVGSDEEIVTNVLRQVEGADAFMARIAYLNEHCDERARDEIRLLDGRVFERYTAPVRGSDGVFYGRVWSFRDATEHRRHAEELEKARNEAEAARAETSRYARKLENDLEFGRRIQQGMLPERLPEVDGWEIAARFSPAFQVAGDFYDAFELDTGHIGFIIADVSGKGVGAALFMALFQSLLRAAAERASRSSTCGKADQGDAELESCATRILHDAITSTNDYISRVHARAHMFASAVFGVACPVEGAIKYINAGHEPPVVVRRDGSKERLLPTGPALGLVAGARYGVADLTLEQGEMLLAYTDGVTEARDAQRGFFGDDGLMSLIEKAVPDVEAAASTQDPETAAALLDRIEAAVKVFTTDADPSDDLTLLALRRVG